MNLELESYTLSAIISDGEIAEEAYAKLEPKHFSIIDKHRDLYAFLKNNKNRTYEVFAKDMIERGLHDAYLTILNNPLLGVYKPSNITALMREYLTDQYNIAKKNMDGERAYKFWRRLQALVDISPVSLYTDDEITAEIRDASQNGLGIDKYFTGLLDDHYTPIRKQTTVITGAPSSGKSNFLDAMSVRLAVKYKWKFLVFSPESQPIKLHLMNIAQKYLGKPIMGTKMDTAEVEKFILAHYEFINTNEVNHNIDFILALAKTRDIDAVIIDPWNEISITGEVEHRFISESLSKIKIFSYKKDCHIFIVAHPTKLRKAISGDYEGMFPPASAYDIDGSAKWYSKPDNILSVWRHPDTLKVEIHVQKIKYEGVTGRRGMQELRFVPGVNDYVYVEAFTKKWEDK